MKNAYITLALLVFIFTAAKAQIPTTSSPVDTNSYGYKSEQMKSYIATRFSTDSVGAARAVKMYGRWQTYWDMRVCNDAPSGTSMFTPHSKALDFVLSGVDGCSGNGYKGNWANIGPNYNSLAARQTIVRPLVVSCAYGCTQPTKIIF